MPCKIIVLLLVLSSCSGYMTEQGGFFSKFYRGQFNEAAKMLEEKSEKEGKDQILFLLDRGMALFEAKDYKTAIQVLGQAERLTELKDYTSINEELVSVITTDNFKKFYPLDYELIMINVYLALAYYMVGDYEGALVECRRIDLLVNKLKNNGMKAFDEVSVAWFISGLIYEKQKKYNDAFIDYKRVLNINPKFKYAIYDVYRTAVLSGNRYYAEDLSDKYPDLKLKEYYSTTTGKKGTLVFLYFDGLIPIKRTNPNNSMLPKLYTRTFNVSKLYVNVPDQNIEVTSSELLDLEDTARKNLDERIGRIMAKRMLGIGTKVAIGYGVAKATDSNTLGILTGLLLQATTTPDNRSWSTLPRSFQATRLNLIEGEHRVNLSGTGVSKELTVAVKTGEMNIFIYRTVQ